MSFANDHYEIIPSVVSADACKIMAKDFELSEQLILNVNRQDPSYRCYSTNSNEFPFADEMVNKSFSWYSPLIFEALSVSVMKDIVEETVGYEVYPTYSYARIYYNGSEMKRHTDRACSEFSVSCCISVDDEVDPWPIYFERTNGEIIELKQKPGDIVIYKGNVLPHWRLPYHGQKQIQAFMFYVDANGPRAELKYDTRPMLGMPPEARRMNSETQWEKFFGKPGGTN